MQIRLLHIFFYTKKFVTASPFFQLLSPGRSGGCFIFITLCVIAFSSCSDDDSFSTSRSNILTMDVDTVFLDTVFSTVPTPARSFWIRNKSKDGIRCSNIRLEKGNQSGFRVNVDGTYLGETFGYQTSNVEIRKGDSIRVFVELTAVQNHSNAPEEIEDNIIFTLESGVRQTVNLNAWSWDADIVDSLKITEDTFIDNFNGKPLIIMGNIDVEENATLTLAAGTTIYFHDKAGIDVKGRLISQGTAEKNVTLRGDRLDNMFDYLPYDNLPGRWKGVHFCEDSYNNIIDFTDIHSACHGIVLDSCNVEKLKLTVSNSSIHNCEGHGILTASSKLNIVNTQITNTMLDCLTVLGGDVDVLHCTIAQFYPFVGGRGHALFFSNYLDDYLYPLTNISIRNSIVTGYSKDEIFAEGDSEKAAFNYHFSNSLLRTIEVTDDENFENIIFEDVKDTETSGEKNFKTINIDLIQYDFHLSEESKARGRANKEWSLEYDRDGLKPETEEVNIGCYY